MQRVNRAKVTANNKTTGEIGKGLYILVGLGKNDVGDEATLKKLAKKVLKVRLWPQIIEEENPEDQMEESDTSPPKPKPWNTNVMQNDYGLLVVSQFTLFGFFKGNKPDFHHAMKADMALEMFNKFVEILREEYDEEKVQVGAFGEYMHIDMECDGPVTMSLDSEG